MVKNTVKILFDLILIAFGCFLVAFSIKNLIMPHNLLSGGLTGVVLILYQLTGWDVDIQYFLYNIPLLLAGFFFVGKRFFFYSIFAVCIITLWLNLIPLGTSWTNNPMLGAIFGGIIMGAGGAIILRLGGSTGGVDVVGRIITKFKDVNIARFTFFINTCIILVSAYFFGVELAMYTLISIYATSKIYETLLNHIDRITIFVITDKGDEVSKLLLEKMQRGLTTWNAHGVYSQQDKQVLYAVITRQQLDIFEEIVFKIDPKAFITYLPTQSVRGNFKVTW